MLAAGYNECWDFGTLPKTHSITPPPGQRDDIRAVRDVSDDVCVR